MPPSVSVIIPVHNCLPYLEDALSSVYHQSLARQEVEVVAVDDGSTDGSSELLAAWAAHWPQLRIFTQEASGGAGRPRNVGIEQAAGEYVFYLDGDDCLGPEALDRLLAMAREHDSDVVLAKLVGVNREVPSWVFRKDVARAGLASGIYYSLMPFKLIRRSLLITEGIRFPEHMRISEDQHFIASCYLAADVISILSSYDSYYLVRRQDDSNTSFGGLEFGTLVRQAQDTVQMLQEASLPAPVRAHLVGRHVRTELLRRFNRDFLSLPSQEQKEMVSEAGPYARDWDVGGMLEEMGVPERLLVRALQSEDLTTTSAVIRWTVEGARAPLVPVGGRWLLAGPGFDMSGREDRLYVTGPPVAVVQVSGICLEGGRLVVTGHALLRGVDSDDCRVGVLLRHPGSGRVVAAEVSSIASPHVNAVERGRGVLHRSAGFRATLDAAGSDLEEGRWLLRLTLTTRGRTVKSRLSPPQGFEPLQDGGAGGSLVRLAVDVGARGYLGLRVSRPGPAARTPTRKVNATRWPGSAAPSRRTSSMRGVVRRQGE